MFYRILVPLDGSSRAEQALPVAARLARFSNGTVVLLRVVSPPTELVTFPATDPEIIWKLIDTDFEEARNYLESITNGSNLVGVHTKTAVMIGQPAATILSIADTQQIDQIVLCSHGYMDMKRCALSSVAQQVAYQAPVPVLLLREGGPALVGTPPYAEGPLRALVPLDGSVRAKAVLVPAVQLIAALSVPGPSALHLTQVVVVSEAAKISCSEQETMIHKAKQYLSATAEHIREGLVADLKLAITWSVTFDEDVAAGIVRVAERGEDTGGAEVLDSSDLIAMATHGYSGWQRWAMNSIPEHVLKATRLPLLIVRPPDTLEQGRQS